MSSAIQEGTVDEQSQRDVVFTPFMLRVREAVGHDVVAPTVLHMEASRPTSIAVAVDEWFGLRARAEHVISEANGMLDPDAERIALDDEYGTGNLAFTLRWRERALRICVQADPAHRGHVVVDDPGWVEQRAVAGHLKPVDQQFLEDLAVSLLSVQPTTVKVDDE